MLPLLQLRDKRRNESRVTPPSPMLEEVKIVLESFQPPTDGWCNPPKVFIVSFLPKTPSSHQKDFKKEWASPRVFSLLKQLEMAGEGGPANTKFLPARLTEGASEDHMVDGFLDVLPTWYVVKIIPNVIMPPFEHIACVEPVHEKQPSKHLQLHCTF